MELSVGVTSVTFLHQPDDIMDDNIDVVVRLDDGSSYGITFFTPMNILSILERYKSTGECLDGTFLWARDMVIVRDLKRVTVERSIHEMVRSGEYRSAFGLLETVD